MFWFCIKKNFCDGWDTIFMLLVVNLIMVSLAVAAFFALAAVVVNQIVMLAGFALFLCILMIPLFAYGSLAAQVAAFKSVTLKEFFIAFVRVWKDAVRFALIIAALVFMAVVALPFYLRMGGLLGIALGAVIFWFFLLSAMAFQWFIPLRFLLPQDSFFKSLKKSYIIFFDNTAFSVCYFFYQLTLMALSVVVFFLLPSFAGMALAQTNALRLRLYKYDWLQSHPEEAANKKRHIPWDELLAEDRETLGPRSLRSFIFPWKD